MKIRESRWLALFAGLYFAAAIMFSAPLCKYAINENRWGAFAMMALVAVMLARGFLELRDLFHADD